MIENKTNYEKCCPEYITQAENFLKSNKQDFKTTEDLGLALIYKEMIINITGKAQDGTKFNKYIIEKEL